VTAIHAGPWEITEPGVYEMTDADYHADLVPGGSLSVSGARLLLPPSCPARYAWQREHPPTPKPEYDRGHGAHRLALGVGPTIRVVDADDWRTKAARQARTEAHAAGEVPLLAADYTDLVAMVAALRDHPIAGELLDPTRMVPEQSIFWRDPETGIMRRARIDAVSQPDTAGPPYLVDYKTTRSGDPEHISRALWHYGYAMQADWYITGNTAVELADPEAQFLLIVQETEPPYVVGVMQPDDTALHIGHLRNRQAIDIYRACTTAGRWPGHVPETEIRYVGLPPWAERQHTNTEYEEITL
jgi:hypothetical protein